MSKHKTNPRRRPASQADVKAARLDGIEKGLFLCVWTLADRGLLTPEQIQGFAAAVNDTADSINRGYLKWADIERALHEEYEVEVKLK